MIKTTAKSLDQSPVSSPTSASTASAPSDPVANLLAGASAAIDAIGAGTQAAAPNAVAAPSTTGADASASAFDRAIASLIRGFTTSGPSASAAPQQPFGVVAGASYPVLQGSSAAAAAAGTQGPSAGPSTATADEPTSATVADLPGDATNLSPGEVAAIANEMAQGVMQQHLVSPDASAAIAAAAQNAAASAAAQGGTAQDIAQAAWDAGTWAAQRSAQMPTIPSTPTSAGSSASTSSPSTSSPSTSSPSKPSPLGDYFNAAAKTPTSPAQQAALADPNKTPGTFVPNTTTLYPSGSTPTSGDVFQHGSEDCQMLSTFAAWAIQSPSTITNMIKPKADGTFDVSMYDPQGKPIVVNVNSDVQKQSDGNTITTTGASGQSTWATVLENATLKYNSVYKLSGAGETTPKYGITTSLMGISPAQIIPAFLGSAGASTYVAPGTQSPDQVKKTITDAIQSGQALITGPSKHVTIAGDELNNDHAYTIVGVSTQNESDYVEIRNPRGEAPRKGATGTSANGTTLVPLDQFAKIFDVVGSQIPTSTPAAGPSTQASPSAQASAPADPNATLTQSMQSIDTILRGLNPNVEKGSLSKDVATLMNAAAKGDKDTYATALKAVTNDFKTDKMSASEKATYQQLVSLMDAGSTAIVGGAKSTYETDASKKAGTTSDRLIDSAR